MTAEQFIYGLTGMTMQEAVQDFLIKQKNKEEQGKESSERRTHESITSYRI